MKLPKSLAEVSRWSMSTIADLVEHSGGLTEQSMRFFNDMPERKRAILRFMGIPERDWDELMRLSMEVFPKMLAGLRRIAAAQRLGGEALKAVKAEFATILEEEGAP